MDDLLSYIKTTYKEGEPILLKDLKTLDLSYDNLRQKLKKLTDSKLIERATDGIYYYGDKPTVEEITLKRFISRNNKIFGYYTKNSLLSKLGFNVKADRFEIITNEFGAIVRDIDVLGEKVRVRRSKVEINNTNFHVLELLDIIRDLDEYNIEQKRIDDVLKSFVNQYKITKDSIDKYICFYPYVTFRNYYKYNIENILN